VKGHILEEVHFSVKLANSISRHDEVQSLILRTRRIKRIQGVFGHF